MRIRMLLTNWRDGILRWALMVINGIVVVWAVRPAALISLVAIVIVPLSVPLAGRPEDVARAPSSFCLPGFRESLRRRFFIGAVAMGLAISVPSLWSVALSLYRREELTGYVDVAAAILAGGWIAFLLALRYTYTAGPLAEAGPAAA